MSRLAKSLIVSLTLFVAYGAQKGKTTFSPGPASSYENKVTIQKLTIAAVPYESDAQTKTAFGKVNPNEYGVLPVLLVMQNDSDQVLRLDRMKIEYILPNRERVEPIPAKDVPYVRAPKRPNMNPSPLPIPRRSGKNPLQIYEIEGRAFTAKMLPPGESAHGFVYFHTTHRNDSVLYITGIYEASTGNELFYFEIPLKSER
jgi:hypothetical protein